MTDYQAAIDQAAAALADAEAQAAKQRHNAARSAQRYAGLIAEADAAVEAAQLALRQAQRQEDVDALNAIRDKAFPLAEQLNVHLYNFPVQDALNRLHQQGQPAVRRLSNGQSRQSWPFVRLDRVISRMTEGPPSKRPRSVMAAMGLLDEQGERIYIR